MESMAQILFKCKKEKKIIMFLYIYKGMKKKMWKDAHKTITFGREVGGERTYY